MYDYTDSEKEKFIKQALEQLLEAGLLKPCTTANGIAKRVLTSGLKGLSNRQFAVIDSLLDKKCSQCKEKIPLSQLYACITDNPIICADCRYTAQKYDLQLPRSV